MDDYKKKIVHFGRLAFEHELIFGASGNLSVKSGAKIYITRSGSYLGYLTEKDIICFDISAAKPRAASMETQMHLNCYMRNKSVSAVFHSQPLYATLLGASAVKINLNYVPETMYYIKKIGVVNYAHAGSPKLAELVGEKAEDCDIIILKNHGLTVTAANLNEAILKTIAFEFLAKSIIIAKTAKLKIPYLPKEIKNDFNEYIQSFKRV